MKIKILASVGCLIACMVCPAAFAQGDYPKYDIFFGYSLMRTAEYDNVDLIREELSDTWSGYGLAASFKKSRFLEKGFSTSFTYNFTPVIGLDTSFRYNSGYILSASLHEKEYDYSLGTVETNYEEGFKKKKIALLVGPRFTFRNAFGKVTPFVYGLAGLSHDRLSYAYDSKVSYFHWGENYKDSDSESIRNHSSFGVAIGGGLDVPISKNFAVRAIQADYFMANHPKDISEATDTPNKRFDNISMSFGVVVRFGK